MIEAVVWTGTFETTYRRTGAGSPVLLLASGAGTRHIDWLMDQLAPHFRIVAPVMPSGFGSPPYTGAEPDDRGLEGWLRGLIDGLGLERPAILADAHRGASLFRFMVLDPDRVRRMALFHTTEHYDSPAASILLGDGDPLPILIAGLPPLGYVTRRPAVLDTIIRFLAAP